MKRLLLVAALVAIPALAGERDVAVRAGHVFPVSGPPIQDGIVVVRDGRITEVGPASRVAVPGGVTLVHEPDAWLVPGFVDLHSHVGGVDINDMIHPVNPDLSVLRNVVPGNESLLDAVAGGVTTILFLPGSGTNLSGFGALLKTYGRDLDEMLVRFPGAMKIAQAGNPERRSGEIGRGRLGMNFNLREALAEGRAYHDAWTAWERDRAGTPPRRIARLEWMRGLFTGEIPVLVHGSGMQVTQASIRMLHDEFGLNVILSHVEWDSPLADPLIVERGMPVNVGPRSLHPDYETGEIYGLAARHHQAGVERLSINTDSPVVPQEELPFQAALGVRYGLPWDVALRGLTLQPATDVGIGHRVGSLEPGKDGDLVLWTGDPLDPRSHVLVAIGAGRIAIDQRVPGARRW